MKLPVINSNELIKVVGKMGFKYTRQKGSHSRFVHTDGRKTTIPIHKGEDIDRGLLIKIIKKDLQISVEEFIEYL